MALYELVAPIALQKDLFRVEERLFIKAMNFTAKSLGTTCQAKQMNSPYQTIIRCRVHLEEDYSIWSSLIQVAPVNTGSNQATQCSKLFCPHVPLVILGYNQQKQSSNGGRALKTPQYLSMMSSHPNNGSILIQITCLIGRQAFKSRRPIFTLPFQFLIALTELPYCLSQNCGTASNFNLGRQ